MIGFVLLPIRPAELGKTTNTTFTTSNNLQSWLLLGKDVLLPRRKFCSATLNMRSASLYLHSTSLNICSTSLNRHFIEG